MNILEGAEEELAKRFLAEAGQLAEKSTCTRARCGTLIVQGEEIIGDGVNSPPAGLESQRRCSTMKETYDQKVTDKTCCVHAEQRAIMDALRNNPEKIKGSILYFMRIDEEGNMTRAGEPYCTVCSKMALDAGVGTFILWKEEGVCAYNTDEYNELSFAFNQEH